MTVEMVSWSISTKFMSSNLRYRIYTNYWDTLKYPYLSKIDIFYPRNNIGLLH